VGRWGDCRNAGSRLLLGIGAAAQAVAFELDAVSIVNDAIQDRVAEGWVGNDIVPLRQGDLACDQERSLVVAIIDDLEKIATLIGGERLGSPIIDDEQVDAFDGVFRRAILTP
jgi:hypothetical protein